ncbi:MAG: trypsin-like peptidase domain-containing protein [Oscillospiraceae bacterium]|nr:trypsin-like peptidase domain-containing protein [Oscillospiraceae bacterium]MBQ9046163.1 trypsin-like peptidase domain-containing protein [Oscillospiraceae bacterium]
MESKEIKTKFFQLKTRTDVADILGIDERSLRFFLFKVRPENMYIRFQIAKRGGGFREICAPNRKLKSIQRKLADILEIVYREKACAYGFVRGKNIVQNARNHTKSELVLNIDLKDFFSQIHFGRVRGMLIKPPYGLGEEAATTIAQIACLDGKLPQGAPCSPVITNMICASLDNQLMRLAKKTGCIYTRYADDITFSTNKKQFDDEIIFLNGGSLELGKGLSNVLTKNSFIVNPDKITLRAKSSRQEVTGLVVNQFPNLRREYVKQLRAIIYNCSKNGVYHTAQQYIEKGFCNNTKIATVVHDPNHREEVENWFRQVIVGKINYIRQIKGAGHATYKSFALRYNRLVGEDFFEVPQDDLLAELMRSVYVLESEERQGSGFAVKGIGLFTSNHVTGDGAKYEVFLPDGQGDVEIKGIISNGDNLIDSDDTIDFALFDVPFANESNLEIGDSDEVKFGSDVIIASFPDYAKGNSVRIEHRTVAGEARLFGSKIIIIDGVIFHGASGGVVVNDKNKVIGIVKAGIQDAVSKDELLSNQRHGFVPINLVMQHIREHQRPASEENHQETMT